MYTALTIAGTDPSGGAGIQADLKTFTAYGVYGMSVITAVVAQNTCGVTDVENMSVHMVERQLDAVFTDIFPDAVKIGMVSSIPIIDAIVAKLLQYRPRNVVLDPVMVATSGDRLLDEAAELHLINRLLPLADLITPNIPETSVLCGAPIKNKQDMVLAAKAISAHFGGAVLIKGGHLEDCSDDLLYAQGDMQWLTGKRIDTRNTHGTGCTLSSAIAANLARKHELTKAVEDAKHYVTDALSTGLDLGKGSGPLNHCYAIPNREIG